MDHIGVFGLKHACRDLFKIPEFEDTNDKRPYFLQ